MKAVRIERPGTLNIVHMDLYHLSRGEIFIRVMTSGIYGTDFHFFVENIWAAIR